MREIKFRVWDKENNCFFKPTYEAYKGRLEDLSISLSGDLTMHTYDTPLIHESCFPNRFVIQQYTGLKDKNGKDIYLDDIVAINKETTEGFYRNDYYEVVVNDFMKIPVIDSEIGQEVLYKVNMLCKVVGNIYENPELLQS